MKKQNKQECRCHCHYGEHDCRKEPTEYIPYTCVHCQPSKEKECICTNKMGTSMRGDCPLYKEHLKIDIVPQPSGWEEDFDNKFTVDARVEYLPGKTKPIRILKYEVNESGKDIKSFISQLLKEQREQILDELKTK